MDILLIALLTLLNGAFAMSELALTASRKVRLTSMAEAGDGGAQAALVLLENPTRFLSSVQVGITSIGVLNGIIGEAANHYRREPGVVALPDTAAIVQFRNILIHSYDIVRPLTVWEILQDSLPTLRAEVARLLAADPAP